MWTHYTRSDVKEKIEIKNNTRGDDNMLNKKLVQTVR